MKIDFDTQQKTVDMKRKKWMILDFKTEGKKYYAENGNYENKEALKQALIE